MTKQTALIMVDTETLGMKANALIAQFGLQAVDMDDPETILREIEEFFPLEPQLKLDRTVTASTIIWWMRQSEAARQRFNNNDINDMDALIGVVTATAMKIKVLIESLDDYEVCARGPQFDIVKLESLFEDCGVAVPWAYNKVTDLRTMMKQAGISTSDVEKPHGLVDHVALHDSKYQVLCYFEARRRLHSTK